VWSGGDSVSLGLATISIGQGRKAAEAIHATPARAAEPKAAKKPPVGPEKIKIDFYEAKARAQRSCSARRSASRTRWRRSTRDDRRGRAGGGHALLLVRPVLRLRELLDVLPEQLLREEPATEPGHYYIIELAVCDGCKKCAEECPCGFLEMV
jgi:formate dehydrogenase (NADP+) beta subunit